MPAQRPTYREALLRLHRWAGLTLAGFLLLTGLTGIVIAWTDELDAWLNPQLFHTPGTPAAGPMEMLTLADQVEAAHPQVQVRVLPLTLQAGEAVQLWVQSAVAAAPPLGYDQVFVHPVTGQWLGQRQWGAASLAREHLLPFVYKLHYSLHLPGPWGLWLLGGVALLWALDVLWALWLAFPSRKAWRKSFAFRWRAGGHKLYFDLHRSGSVWLWPLMLVLAVSGVGMNLRDEVMRPFTSWFSPVTPEPRDERPGLPDGTPRIGRAQALEAAVQAARAQGWVVAGVDGADALDSQAHACTPEAAPSCRVVHPWRWFDWSRGSGLHAVAFSQPGRDPYGPGLAPHWVYLDAATGAVVDARSPLQGSAGDVFLRAQYSLHSGRILGLPGRVLVSLLGVAVSVISVTGVLIWWRKRKARAAR